MIFKKKPIESIQELEVELKKTYDRTDPEVIHEYLSAETAETAGSYHTISGCDDCPFVRNVQVDQEKSHTFCLWDGTKSDISPWIGPGTSSCPSQCPLRESKITVRLDGN